MLGTSAWFANVGNSYGILQNHIEQFLRQSVVQKPERNRHGKKQETKH